MTGTLRSRLAGVRDWLNAGLAFFYPEVCQICGRDRATQPEGYVCANCQGQVKFLQPPFCRRCGRPVEGEVTIEFDCATCRESPPAFAWARSSAAAKDPLLEAIHRYKYQRALWIEPFISTVMLRPAVPALTGQGWDWIVPVPLHPTKEREREFNQAERLARQLSRAVGVPLNRQLLERRVFTRTQTQLSREERLKNVRGAFALRPRARLAGDRVILVDDVLTTGATTSACAAVLREGGAGDVCVWTLARGV